MGLRRKTRELTVQVLYALEFSHGDSSEVFDLICENFTVKRAAIPLARKIVLGVCENRKQIDDLISAVSLNWRIERMAKVDISILRTAVYEILYLDDVPPKVAIDEALEIGKKFGTEKSAPFINGILDSIVKRLVPEVFT